MAIISGNTYPVKNELKALGGKWDAARKCWIVPDDKAVEARKLVNGDGSVKTKNVNGFRRRGTWTGCSCGSVVEYSKNYDCWTCKQDVD
jgi:hypothetical protein